MTHPEETATIERDLRAVDAALAAGAAGHDNPMARDLQELALALRADVPVPRAAFADELGKRVSEGFPDEAGTAERQVRATVRRLRSSAPLRALPRVNLLPAASIVAPLLLIVATVFALGGPPEGGSGGADDASGGGGSGSVAVPESRQAAPGAGGALVQPAPPGGGFAPGRRDRRIERAISMTLTAPDEEIPDVADGVNRVTARNGGFVLRSELDSSDDGATGSFELRIPVDRLQGALRDLARLATVSSQGQAGQDVTRDFVTAKDRLQAARAERRSLLRRLADADTDAEAEALRRRLDLVAGEINGLRGQLRDLRLRTDYATVSLDLVGEEDDTGSGGAGGSFDDAVADAGALLVGFAGVLIRVLAVALPLGLLALIAWVAGAGLRRRRRESALA